MALASGKGDFLGSKFGFKPVVRTCWEMRSLSRKIISISLATALYGSLPSNAHAEAVPLVQESGIYVLPVNIGGAMTLKFVLDSGASDVTLPSDVVQKLMRQGVVKQRDFIGAQTYGLADGSTVRSARLILHELKVGNVVVRDVTASVAPVGGALLLGQSFLSKLPRWSIDNTQHALILGEDPLPAGVDTSPQKALARTSEPSFEAAKAAYERGDFAAAARLSKPLAEQGDAMSQIAMAFLYFSGQGVPKDYTEAARWYRLAADQGNASGQHSLGRMYAAGLGVPQDPIAAYKWFNLAVSNGDTTATQSRDAVGAKMTVMQINEAQKQSRDWKPRSQ
ncbi:retroviral-like aspartic protease family protein [Magnetospirillum sp. ME-1]|uniref:retroviral-like aspartic protease family protein n=1 Tax=Magnetospirillum sp. ME-1 TaxID=1639348 RepID=UPI000A198442|nr:retroviral-like aspartic protease family protein [Magnetospirillum sp. ME-1]